jgi:hypothetical protein
LDASSFRALSRVGSTPAHGLLSSSSTFLLSLNFFISIQEFHTLAKPSTDNQDPLYRLFHREGTIGLKLLKQVRKDLGDVAKVCEGSLKQTNHLRDLISALTKGMSFISLS